MWFKTVKPYEKRTNLNGARPQYNKRKEILLAGALETCSVKVNIVHLEVPIWAISLSQATEPDFLIYNVAGKRVTSPPHNEPVTFLGCSAPIYTTGSRGAN